MIKKLTLYAHQKLLYRKFYGCFIHNSKSIHQHMKIIVIYSYGRMPQYNKRIVLSGHVKLWFNIMNMFNKCSWTHKKYVILCSVNEYFYSNTMSNNEYHSWDKGANIKGEEGTQKWKYFCCGFPQLYFQ